MLRLVEIPDEAKLYGVICSPLEIKMVKLNDAKQTKNVKKELNY